MKKPAVLCIAVTYEAKGVFLQELNKSQAPSEARFKVTLLTIYFLLFATSVFKIFGGWTLEKKPYFGLHV